MKIGILGTGMVGQAIGGKLVTLGHEVTLGSRLGKNEKASAWMARVGKGGRQGTFAEAAAFGELLFNCTAGTGSLEALAAAGERNLDGKILVDVANPLEFSKGMPPTLSIGGGDDSLGERIQRKYPRLKVVKSLNTISAPIMVDPSRVPGDHEVFVSGNDAEAKARVTEILKDWFGWRRVIDLGDITTARGTEGYLLLWLRLWGTLKTADFNIHVVS